jgi:flavodoxin
VKAIILYDSRFGNTEKIAKSLEIGLKATAGIQIVVCTNTNDIPSADSLKEYDILCVGSPTENMTASKSIKEFLAKLNDIDLSSKNGFAFDTKLDSRFSGSAAKYIEKELVNQGFRIITPRQSAIVFSIKERGAIVGARLKEGEEKRFEEVGRLVGTATVQTAAQNKLIAGGSLH